MNSNKLYLLYESGDKNTHFIGLFYKDQMKILGKL